MAAQRWLADVSIPSKAVVHHGMCWIPVNRAGIRYCAYIASMRDEKTYFYHDGGQLGVSYRPRDDFSLLWILTTEDQPLLRDVMQMLEWELS